MYYQIASILRPIFIESIGDYKIMYDDLNLYSVWYEKHCLFENTSIRSAKEFCNVRVNRKCTIVLVLNTFFVSIHGQTFSKYVDENSWHMRYHFPWVGFYPLPTKVLKGTLLYNELIDNLIEAEKKRTIKSVYKPYLNQNHREKYSRI
ncbi:hypothetical protein E8L90_08205 [Brevibacillus antibioticus]|uniref:Uncharacterized protein n=1 Tax=Brevibacillus antibioticus TaxID=2570228 RepID=A0A4U2Y4R9_9BACL|nr:hypothetical protein [Brevibacillus antibioticus]TKI55429.1 hypothetical protein E8L90_08205 [Brevibacillus antibioticus]